MPNYLFTAHINLNNEYLPYKHVIGQLILDVGEIRRPTQFQ